MGSDFENLPWKIENGLRNVNWLIGAKEGTAKMTYKKALGKK